jgi:hypothetical protein
MAIYIGGIMFVSHLHSPLFSMTLTFVSSTNSASRRMYSDRSIRIVFLTTTLSFNGSIVTLATDRFKAANTFSKLGALTGLNQAMQVVGSILIAPLIKQ